MASGQMIGQMALLLCTLILLQPTCALQPTHSVGRRSLIFGAAATSLTSLAPAAFAEKDEVIARAKSGSLTTTKVIFRALRDELIEPKEIEECDPLDKIYKIDLKAAEEMRMISEDLLKLRSATEGTRYRGRYSSALDESYELSRLVEQKIRERASEYNALYINECVEDPAAKERNKNRDFENGARRYRD